MMTIEAPATLYDDDKPESEAAASQSQESQPEASAEPESQSQPEPQDLQDEPTPANQAETASVETVVTEHAETTSEDEFWAKMDLYALAAAEHSASELESRLESLKSEVKDTKEELKAAEITIRRLTHKIYKMSQGKEFPTPSSTHSIPKSTHSNEATPLTDESSAPGWESVPTAELLDGIKGLGAKKLDAIVELAPTAGKLEELRGEASRAFKPFREVLPKGCGQAIADAIEDRLVELVAKHSTPPASEQVEPRVPDPIRIMVEKIESDIENERQGEGDVDPTTKEDYIPDDMDDDEDPFVQGFKAFVNMEPIAECPRVETSEGFHYDKNWVTGWIYGKTVAEWDEASSDVQPEESSDEPSEAHQPSDGEQYEDVDSDDVLADL